MIAGGGLGEAAAGGGRDGTTAGGGLGGTTVGSRLGRVFVEGVSWPGAAFARVSLGAAAGGVIWAGAWFGQTFGCALNVAIGGGILLGAVAAGIGAAFSNRMDGSSWPNRTVPFSQNEVATKTIAATAMPPPISRHGTV
jgi:hypothetical protein